MTAPTESRRQLHALLAALRDGNPGHSEDCTTASPLGGPPVLTRGCPWCDRVRAHLEQEPAS